MAAPNLLSLSTGTGKSYFANLSATSNATLITPSAGQVYKINSITVSNIDGSTNYDVSLYLANSTVTVPIAYLITVPAKSSLVVVDKQGQFYLEESTSLQGGTSAANKLSILVGYELLS